MFYSILQIFQKELRIGGKIDSKATLEDVPQIVSLAIQMWKSHTVEDLTKILVLGFI